MKNMLGVVVIGRNEGVRLRVCLESLLPYTDKIIYVDSGSTDNSVLLAKELRIDVVNLDTSIPFTAARARNEGFECLCKLYPKLSLVQFVDGDCEIVEGWLEQASYYLTQHSDVAVVCGRRRERYPNASLYNMLCDIEWNTPIGVAKACGGDALMRISIVQELSGFNPALIAGEEPELCLRIRQYGWKVWRLDIDMSIHDANITRFGQWWRRNVRAGFAYALGKDLHGNSAERHNVRESRRIWLWGFYAPIFFMISGLLNPLLFIFFLVYPIQIARIGLKKRNIINRNWTYAFFIMLGKFPEMQGQLRYILNKLMSKRSTIIEYKG